MAYGDTGTVPVFQWTNDNLRHPSKWTITPYFNNTADTGATVIAYSEDAAQDAFGRLVKLAKRTNVYDQVLCTRNDEQVPSAPDTGAGGDSI